MFGAQSGSQDCGSNLGRVSVYLAEVTQAGRDVEKSGG